MPTQEESLKYLYLILTAGGPPQINWPAICAQFSLQPAAANMRWYRVKQCMQAGKKCPLRDGYEFLWALLKNSNRDKVVDWKPIAQKCNTTVGAASTRFYRMRKAWEKEEASSAGTNAATETGGEVVLSTAPKVEKMAREPGAAKRKRGRPGAGEKGARKNDVKEEEDEEGDEEVETMPPKKRARGAKVKVESEKGSPSPGAQGDGLGESNAFPPARMFRGFDLKEGGGPAETTVFKGFGLGGAQGEDTFVQEEVGTGSEDESGKGADDWVSQWLEEV